MDASLSRGYVAGYRDFERCFTYEVFGRLMGEVLTLAMQSRNTVSAATFA